MAGGVHKIVEGTDTQSGVYLQVSVMAVTPSPVNDDAIERVYEMTGAQLREPWS